MIRRLLKQLLYGGSSSLRPFEAGCVACLRNALSPEGREILDSQLQSIDLIQRFSDDKLVTFHLDEKKTRLFPNRTTELYAANLIIPRKPEKSLTCEFVFHEGRISSIEFGRSPRGVEASAVTCKDIEVFEDLMASPTVEPSATIEGPMLAAIRLHGAIVSVIGPAARNRRESLQKRLATFAVPTDYSELLAETDGFVIDGWHFLGTRARKIVLPGRTYFVVAESADAQAALCFSDGERSSIVLYDQIDDDEEPVGDRFLEALVKAIRRQSTPRPG